MSNTFKRTYILIIDVGANPLGVVRSEEGRTSLHIAAAKGLLEILLMLIYKVSIRSTCCYPNNVCIVKLYSIHCKAFLRASFSVKCKFWKKEIYLVTFQ